MMYVRPISCWVNTSPEFWMKNLLSSDPALKNIFNISFSFRDEPISDIHRSQFLMLEWYRSHSSYENILNDSIELIQHLSNSNKFDQPKIIHFMGLK